MHTHVTPAKPSTHCTAKSHVKHSISLQRVQSPEQAHSSWPSEQLGSWTQPKPIPPLLDDEPVEVVLLDADDDVDAVLDEEVALVDALVDDAAFVDADVDEPPPPPGPLSSPQPTTASPTSPKARQK